MVISDNQLIETHFLYRNHKLKALRLRSESGIDLSVCMHVCACVCLCEYVSVKRKKTHTQKKNNLWSASVISSHVYLVLMYAFKILTLRFSA